MFPCKQMETTDKYRENYDKISWKKEKDNIEFCWLIEANIKGKCYYTGMFEPLLPIPIYSSNALEAKRYTSKELAVKDKIQLHLLGKPIEHSFQKEQQD